MTQNTVDNVKIYLQQFGKKLEAYINPKTATLGTMLERKKRSNLEIPVQP
jgi:hypothetical protein